MDVLESLREATQRQVAFDARRGAFVVGGRLKRGLTRLVRALIDVARHEWPTASCAGCIEVTRRRQGETIERAAHMAVPSTRRAGPILQSRKRRRSSASAFELCVVTTAVAEPVATPQASERRECKGGALATRHGQAVDRDIERLVSRPALIARPSIDPCAATFVTYLHEKLGLVPVAAQVPIYCSRLDFATAIDVLAVDVRTRSKLYLIEVKASRMRGGATRTSANACYLHNEHPGSRPRGSGLPTDMVRSVYWQHQLQLWAMAFTLRTEYGVELAGAAVIRTTPTCAYHYPLADVLDGNARVDAALERALLAL